MPPQQCRQNRHKFNLGDFSAGTHPRAVCPWDIRAFDRVEERLDGVFLSLNPALQAKREGIFAPVFGSAMQCGVVGVDFCFGR